MDAGCRRESDGSPQGCPSTKAPFIAGHWEVLLASRHFSKKKTPARTPLDKNNPTSSCRRILSNSLPSLIHSFSSPISEPREERACAELLGLIAGKGGGKRKTRDGKGLRCLPKLYSSFAGGLPASGPIVSRIPTHGLSRFKWLGCHSTTFVRGCPSAHPAAWVADACADMTDTVFARMKMPRNSTERSARMRTNSVECDFRKGQLGRERPQGRILTAKQALTPSACAFTMAKDLHLTVASR